MHHYLLSVYNGNAKFIVSEANHKGHWAFFQTLHRSSVCTRQTDSDWCPKVKISGSQYLEGHTWHNPFFIFPSRPVLKNGASEYKYSTMHNINTML